MVYTWGLREGLAKLLCFSLLLTTIRFSTGNTVASQLSAGPTSGVPGNSLPRVEVSDAAYSKLNSRFLAHGDCTETTAQGEQTAVASTIGGVSSVSNRAGGLEFRAIRVSLSASPADLNFGNVTVGTSSTQTVTLTNTGTAAVMVSKATVAGTGFSIGGLSLPLLLRPVLSTTFNATFAPAAPGSRRGCILIASNRTSPPVTVALSGTGVTLLLGALPTSLGFGSVAVGSSTSQTVTLNNSGTGSVTVSQATVAGAGFSVSGPTLPIILTVGQNANFSATFAPTAIGRVTGSISIASSATESPATVSLSGTGVTPQLTTNPTRSNFGSISLGSNSILPVVLTNTGSTSLTISQATVTGTGFRINELTLPLTLAVGQSTSYSVTFAPARAGSVTGSVSIVSNATDSPTDEALSGTGTHAVSLSWDGSTSLVAGYNVYRGTVSGGPYTKMNSALAIGCTSYADLTVQAGLTYYYVVTAVDFSNNESAYSDPGQAVVPSP
ncbi:MAG: choice-of-anchor D domain-containing protein [Terriglobia bacterium]